MPVETDLEQALGQLRLGGEVQVTEQQVVLARELGSPAIGSLTFTIISAES